MHSRFARFDAFEHLIAQLGCLFPQTGHAVGDEPFGFLSDASSSFRSSLLAGSNQVLLISHGDQIQPQALRG